MLSELPLAPDTSDLPERPPVAIKVVGVGGAGSNMAARLHLEGLAQLRIAAVNTDWQAMGALAVPEKCLIGQTVTRGLSAGGDPELGAKAVEADREKIADLVKDQELVFVVAGMGGGTGGGAAPFVAEMATKEGALVIAFVTMPFGFEGGRRAQQAGEALQALRKQCDAVVVLPNDLLLQEAGEGESALESLARADEWIRRGVRSVWAMLSKTGIINLDLNLLRNAFHSRGGRTLFALSGGEGEAAIEQVLAGLKLCPLLSTLETARKADHLLVNVVSGGTLTLAHTQAIMTAIAEQFGSGAHVVMGAVMDESLGDRLEVVVLGMSDTGARNYNPRGRVRPNAADAAPGTAPRRASRTRKPEEEAEPNELGLDIGGESQLGGFTEAEPYLFDGQNLDEPTYLRKGIRIAL